MYAAEPKAKVAKGNDINKSGSSEEGDLPAMFLAPQDNDRASTRERRSQLAK